MIINLAGQLGMKFGAFRGKHWFSGFSEKSPDHFFVLLGLKAYCSNTENELQCRVSLQKYSTISVMNTNINKIKLCLWVSSV